LSNGILLFGIIFSFGFFISSFSDFSLLSIFLIESASLSTCLNPNILYAPIITNNIPSIIVNTIILLCSPEDTLSITLSLAPVNIISDPISNNIPIAKLIIPIIGVPPIFVFNKLSKPSDMLPSKSEDSSLYSSLSSENSVSSNLVLMM